MSLSAFDHVGSVARERPAMLSRPQVDVDQLSTRIPHKRMDCDCLFLLLASRTYFSNPGALEARKPAGKQAATAAPM